LASRRQCGSASVARDAKILDARTVPTLQSCPRVVGRRRTAVGKILDAYRRPLSAWGLPVDDMSMSQLDEMRP
jgi:hypothetical protein